MYNKNKTISGLAAYMVAGSFISITLLSGLVLSSSSVSADDVVDQINITVPVSCTISGTGMGTHNANISNGTYQANIGTTTLHAFCNDNEGFALYAAGYTGDEIGGTNSNKLVGTSASNNATIVTGLATSTPNPDVSNWAMKLAITQDSGDTTGTNAFAIDSDTEGSFSAYHTVPNEYTKVAHKNSATDMTASTGGVKLTTTYAAYISKTQPADTYTGQVIYTLVHPSDAAAPIPPVDTPAGYISYNPNATGVADNMADQAISDASTYAYLWAPNFYRTGYGFAGWSEMNNYSDSTKFHGPNEKMSFNAGQYSGNNSGLSLYAIWVKSAGDMQNWTGCQNLAIGDVTALTDRRDNQTYAVAKLADGKCWMIENLRLDESATGNSDGSLAQGYSSSFHGLTSSNYNRQNTLSPVSNMTAWNNDANVYGVGNWYHWNTAIAGSVSSSTANGYKVESTSICPSGWHLPSGGSNSNTYSGEFWNLMVEIMGATPQNNEIYYESEVNAQGKTAIVAITDYPNNFIYSGFYSQNSFDLPSGPHIPSGPTNRGSGGGYWTNTVYGSGSSYFFGIHQNGSFGDVHPNNYWTTSSGMYSIRCLASQ